MRSCPVVSWLHTVADGSSMLVLIAAWTTVGRRRYILNPKP